MKRFVFMTHVSDVFELKLDKYQSGVKDDAVFTTDSRGFFIRLGFGENAIALRLGDTDPEIKPGQKVRLIIEVE